MASGARFAGFTVEGVLDGRSVTATCSGGRLQGDVALVERARELAARREPIRSFAGQTFVPCLDGDVVAVALTVIHACDEVAQVALRR